MAHSNAEADPLFQLLTDALRAGPGSPEWHQAVARLRDGGAEYADEYKLLIAARENLESGKDYRSVRAGPGFTRRLLERLEQEDPPGGKPRGLPTATVIALVSAVALLGVLAFVAWQLIPRGPAAVSPATVQDLEQAYFPTEVASATFDGVAPAIPPTWPTIGQLSLEASKTGLRPAVPAGPPTTLPAGPVGGAVLAPETIPPDEPFAAEVKLLLGRPADDVIVQVFVSGGTDFSPDRTTSGNELVWSLRGTRQQVVSGEASRQADAARPDPAKGPPPQPVTVRVLVNRDAAVVEASGQRVWAGSHGLPPNPRRIGVRFLRAGGGKPGEPAVVQSIRVLK